MSDSPNPLASGAVFAGRYKVQRCIKAGGMGAVYEVIHLETRRRRALKVMLKVTVFDPDLRARFEREATVTADIESDHIVETFDAGVDTESGCPFLVMELLKGEDLGERLHRLGRLPAEEVVALLGQAALALDRTHAAGIVHRDLKPENLFLTHRDDGTPHLKILDFGIAKVIQPDAEKTTRSLGTPVYMPPEQLQGDSRLGPATDLYALAHIAFTLLVGRPYYSEEARSEGGLMSLLLKVMAGAVEPASERAARFGAVLPATFDAWFATATALDPAYRSRDARALVSSLADVLGVSTPSSLGDAPPPAPPSAMLLSTSASAASAPNTMSTLSRDTGDAHRRRRSLTWLVTGALFVGGVAAIVWAAPRFMVRVDDGTQKPDVSAAPQPASELPAGAAELESSSSLTVSPVGASAPGAQPSSASSAVPSASSAASSASSASSTTASPPAQPQAAPKVPSSGPPTESSEPLDPTRIRK